MTPLILSMHSQQPECAKLLISKYKADPNKSYHSESPLAVAIQSQFVGN